MSSTGDLIQTQPIKTAFRKFNKSCREAIEAQNLHTPRRWDTSLGDVMDLIRKIELAHDDLISDLSECLEIDIAQTGKRHTRTE